METGDLTELRALASRLRRAVLVQSKRAHVGHIGSELSIVDIIAALYGAVLHVDDPVDPERDRFILSKGHAALTLYCALAEHGLISQEDLATYCADDSLLGVHPERELSGVDFSTGSLGQGLPVSAGAALAARLQGSSRRIFALLSDAECNEGSVWEGAMFAAHHELGNLTAIIDLNGQQALGYTDDVLSLSPMAPRWRSFGWDVHEVDGHDVGALAATLSSFSPHSRQPHVVIARTTFGYGVDFMESQIKWHYLPMTDEEFAIALDQIAKVDA